MIQLAAQNRIPLVHQKLDSHHSSVKIRDFGVCSHLRQVTHLAHVHLNQHPMLSGLTKLGYSMEKYTVVLAAYYHIYAAIECGIGEFLQNSSFPFDYGERLKLPWLMADLDHFGIDPNMLTWLPLAPVALASPASVGTLIGRLYAIEGATLGGQVVSSHLSQTHSLTADSGARFFNGYGDASETQRRWQEFGAFAESVAGEPDQLECAEVAAMAIFELIEAQLNERHAQFES